MKRESIPNIYYQNWLVEVILEWIFSGDAMFSWKNIKMLNEHE